LSSFAYNLCWRFQSPFEMNLDDETPVLPYSGRTRISDTARPYIRAPSVG
jgi:hypothetical protein